MTYIFIASGMYLLAQPYFIKTPSPMSTLAYKVPPALIGALLLFLGLQDLGVAL